MQTFLIVNNNNFSSTGAKCAASLDIKLYSPLRAGGVYGGCPAQILD